MPDRPVPCGHERGYSVLAAAAMAARSRSGPADGRAIRRSAHFRAQLPARDHPTGDLLYPIGVCDQALYVLGRLRVKEIVPVGDDRGTAGEVLRPLSGPGGSSPYLHYRDRHRLRGHRHHARPPGTGRDSAVADLPAAAGTTAGPARQQRRPPAPPAQHAGHLPAGRVLRR